MGQTRPAIDLSEVNNVLVAKLHSLICQTEDVTTLVELSGAVAKLNMASKGSKFFSEPETEETRIAQAQMDAFDRIIQEGKVEK